MHIADVAKLIPREVRLLCRRREFDRPTSGAALGFTQANLVILPSEAATEFEEFCRLNPRPCPLLEVTEVGRYVPKRLAPDADVRTDLPRYRVYRRGDCVDRPSDVLAYWTDTRPRRENGPLPLRSRSAPLGKGELSPTSRLNSRGGDGGDLVAFLIGCSFTFEAALLEGGIPVRHIEESRNVPMFRTSVGCKSVGRFRGPLVVSMRPMTPQQAERAAEITGQFPAVHGAPIQIGDPMRLGIADLGRPDYGDAVTIRPGEVPVFWACGVTPMEAILRADLELAICHEPGHMFVTDMRDEELRGPQRGKEELGVV
jgi:uncharacterized protein YcsI (UPF0317 family)